METKLLLLFVILYAANVCCKSDVPVGYRVSLAVPSEYSAGFIGRAYLMETDRNQDRTAAPCFRVSLSVKSGDGIYFCSLELFLGDVKVWNSGHYSRFVVSEECVLELTVDGDLHLKDHNNQIGWRTGTAAQSVQRLQLRMNGNLVLVDALNIIKWQSFHFPTDVMLSGQRLDVATRLTSFPPNTNTNTNTSIPHAFHYSLEIQPDKVALYLNSDNSKYSYWEFTPSNNRSINFMQLGSKGLELYNDHYRKIAQISSSSQSLNQPPRFLALNNRTGNMGLFHYFPEEDKFEATFQAVNATCDLPLACKPYGVCTFSNSCSCIHLVSKQQDMIRLSRSDLGCVGSGISGDFCGIGTAMVKMVELEGVGSVLRDGAKRANVSRVECTHICLDNCKCVSAAFYPSTVNGSQYDSQCFIYEFMVGIKQMGEGVSLMVKVLPKGSPTKSNSKKLLLVMVGVVDVLIILLVLCGSIYYLIWKRKRSSNTNNR